MLALVGGLSAGLSVPVRVVLVIAIIASGIFHLRKIAQDRTRKRPLIVYGEQDGWSFRIGESAPVKAELLSSSVSSRWLTVLHFRTPESRFQSFLILPDSLNAENYRRLRMILKIAEKND